MMPHSNDLMVSTPENPITQMRKNTGKSVGSTKKEINDFTNISLAQTGKMRFFLNSSRLELAGLCC